MTSSAPDERMKRVVSSVLVIMFMENSGSDYNMPLIIEIDFNLVLLK